MVEDVFMVAYLDVDCTHSLERKPKAHYKISVISWNLASTNLIVRHLNIVGVSIYDDPTLTINNNTRECDDDII